MAKAPTKKSVVETSTPNYFDQIRNQRTGFVGASVDYAPVRNHSVNLSATYGQDGTGQIGIRYSLPL